jgi:Ala-tRNA(Pro) deacylase
MYVVDFLRSRRVWFEELLHNPTSSATRLARALHIPGRAVAKTVVVRAAEEFVLAVLPATSRIDVDRLRTVLQVDPSLLRMADIDEIARIFHDCEPGSIPPFGRLYGLRTVVDDGLACTGTIVFRANQRHEGLRMQFSDYLALEAPLQAAFAQPIDARSTRGFLRRRERRAG